VTVDRDLPLWGVERAAVVGGDLIPPAFDDGLDLAKDVALVEV
jgi:hypothetical protein